MTLNVVFGARLWIVERAARTMDAMSDVGNAPQGLPKMASGGLGGPATHKPSGIITRVYTAPACLTRVMNSARENQRLTFLLMQGEQSRSFCCGLSDALWARISARL